MKRSILQNSFYKALIIILISGVSCIDVLAAFPKEDLYRIFAHPRYSGLNTAGKEFYLTDDEKWLVALCNLARYDGKQFVQEVILKSETDTSSEEVRQLILLLNNQKSTFPLMPAFSLYKSALVHAKDMGVSGNTGHVSSAGMGYGDRIQQFFPTPAGFAENYYAGSADPVEVVLNLLLGKGDEGVTYRNNILSGEIHYVGVSIQPHKKLCSNAVLDFAKKPQVSASHLARKKKDMEVYWRDCPTGTKVSTRKKSGGFSLMSLFGGRRK